MKNISLLIAVLLVTVNVFGQKLPSEQVEVLKQFEADLAQTQRLVTKPILPAIEDVSTNLNYTVPTKLLTLN